MQCVQMDLSGSAGGFFCLVFRWICLVEPEFLLSCVQMDLSGSAGSFCCTGGFIGTYGPVLDASTLMRSIDHIVQVRVCVMRNMFVISLFDLACFLALYVYIYLACV